MQSVEDSKILRRVATEFLKYKDPSRNIRISAARTIKNSEIKPRLISYSTEVCFYDLGAYQTIKYKQ